MDYSIGTELQAETLILTRGRDFRWERENPDGTEYPVGDLFIELDTRGEHNAVQAVEVVGASGGVYKLGHSGQLTSEIGIYDFASNPLSLAGEIQSKLEALTSIGAGNVLVHTAQLIPHWQLKLTMGTGHNEVQLISFANVPASGYWKLGLGSAATALMPYNATAAQVKSSLEAMAGIGVGNVTVTGDMANGFRVEFIGALANTNVGQLVGYTQGIDPLGGLGWFFGIFGPIIAGALTPPPATIKIITLVQGTTKFNQPMIDSIKSAVTAYFGSYGTLSGVEVSMTVQDATHATIEVASIKRFTESDPATFGVDVTAASVQGALSHVAGLEGVFDTIAVAFYWNTQYQVEFVGALANTEQDKLEVINTLTGPTNVTAVNVDVLKPGKERFTKWHFVIDGNMATLKVESEETDKIFARTPWQLVFLPDGEASGGDPLALGRVAVQGMK